MRKSLYLALAALAAFGCERRDRERAGEEVRKGAGEIRQGAERAGEKIETGAERAAEGTRELGRDVRDGWRSGEPTAPGVTGTEQPSTGMAPSTAPGSLTSDQRASLEASAQQKGYQVSFDENGRISAMKSAANRQP